MWAQLGTHVAYVSVFIHLKILIRTNIRWKAVSQPECIVEGDNHSLYLNFITPLLRGM